MLIQFFIRRFLKQFLVCCTLVTGLLAASNLFVRLPGIMSIHVIPAVVMVMLPLVGLFAVPLASTLSLQLVIGELLIQDELLFLSYVKQARSALYKSIVLFTLLIMTLYLPLVLFWAPTSYNRGKQLLVSFACNQLKHLETKTLHTLIDEVTVYFKDKQSLGNTTQFKNIFLVLKNKTREQYFFTAREGILDDTTLQLVYGSVLIVHADECYTAYFEEAQVNLEQLLHIHEQDSHNHDAKFKILPQLLSSSEKSMTVEFHKRIAQIMWQFLLPFMAFFLLMMRRNRTRSMLWSIIYSGMLFFAQYMTLTLAQAFQRSSVCMLILFYFSPCFLFILFWYFSRKW